ncbi:MAG: DUF2541 family protein [Xanthomonadales bacterium]|nr:DUF2541 family protein [Xanthomonadales bacterium]MBK7144133.1 DUF2541 family protein [Xanthomonadales bacterium]MCC6560507.1 DUF2541 family protein [Xanthomonadales bacterium]
MNLKLSLALCGLVAATALAVPGAAVADAERLLGSTRLTKIENDTDVIRFKKCRRGINAVQLRVERGQVEIEKLWVRYAKGGVEYLNVRDRIGQGGHSRWIDLNGGERCLKAVGVIGDTELSRDQARVEVWGR